MSNVNTFKYPNAKDEKWMRGEKKLGFSFGSVTMWLQKSYSILLNIMNMYEM